jgi:cytochrome c biogenesis protein CcmG/thiol:disulfide interchange protein DsbE|tara:strand:+ start:82 stop:606 length:525 start_codon:yes stop_codon:yes gene_type:complete
MNINFSKIIIFSFVIFSLFVFWKGLKINNNYDTKNLIGNKISNFQLAEINIDDQYISEEDIKNNKFTLINFFASWCSPCRAEHRYLVNLSNEDLDIKIIGINFKDKKKNANNFLKELGNPYSFVGKDSKGKISILFGVYGIPESILVNSDLVIIKKIIGPIDQIQYDEILKLTQ